MNIWLQHKKIGPWKNYLYGKRVYILLGVLAKSALAWPRVGIGAGEAVINHNLTRALEAIPVPVRCIYSNPYSFDLEAARQHTSSFEVVFMSGVGQFVMLEDPSMFNSLLKKIIQEFVSY